MSRWGLILIPLCLSCCLIVAVFAEKNTKSGGAKDGGEKDNEEDTAKANDQVYAFSSGKKKRRAFPKNEDEEPSSTKKKGSSSATTIKTKQSGDYSYPSKSKSPPEGETTTDKPLPTATPTKVPKVSPWEKMPNAPAFVGHLVVPYPTSNFISLTMKQAYVLYLWLQVRRLTELFKEKPKEIKPEGDLSLDDINTMLADFSKTGFMKLPMPYKPPLFLPTDSETRSGKGPEFNAKSTVARPHSLASHALLPPPPLPSPAPQQKIIQTTPAPTTPPPTTPTAAPPPPKMTRKPLIATGSHIFPPPISPLFPYFPAFKSQVDAKKNPKELPSHLPLKLVPGLMSFPANSRPIPKPVYPMVTKPKSKPDTSYNTGALTPNPSPIPPPPLQPNVHELSHRSPPSSAALQNIPPSSSIVPAPPQQPRDRRRFFQRVANYMNKLGAQLGPRNKGLR